MTMLSKSHCVIWVRFPVKNCSKHYISYFSISCPFSGPQRGFSMFPMFYLYGKVARCTDVSSLLKIVLLSMHSGIF